MIKQVLTTAPTHHVVAAVKDRRRVFATPSLAAATVNVIHEVERDLATRVHAFCVMPDHVHIIFEQTLACDEEIFVSRFKNFTLRESRRLELGTRFWQRSFWRRFIRDDRELKAQVDYVLDNPVRKGIVPFWADYPYSGTIHYELE